jgi:hypothetical protein
VGHQLHPEDLLRGCHRVLHRLDDLHAAALTAASRVDLRLDDDESSQLFSLPPQPLLPVNATLPFGTGIRSGRVWLCLDTRGFSYVKL